MIQSQAMNTEGRYHRISLVRELDLQRIQNAKICVIGAGSLGNEVLKNFALYGISGITVVDYDYITTSHLSRCLLFREEDAAVRAPKAVVASRRISELMGKGDVNFKNARIQELEVGFLASFDVVVGCFDNVETRVFTDTVCYHNRIPYVDGGINGLYGRVQVVIPPETPCFCCTLNGSHSDIIDTSFSCNGNEIAYPTKYTPAEPAMASDVGGIQCLEALKVLSGNRSGKLILINGKVLDVQTLDIAVSENCPNHWR